MDPWNLLASLAQSWRPSSSSQEDPCQSTKCVAAEGWHPRLSSSFHMHTYVNSEHEYTYTHTCAHMLFRTVDILESK